MNHNLFPSIEKLYFSIDWELKWKQKKTNMIQKKF